MRKKIIVLFVILTLVFSIAGCGGNQSDDEVVINPNSDSGFNSGEIGEDTAIDYAKIYKPILDRYYWNISNCYPNGFDNLTAGEYYASQVSENNENALELIGYSIEDVNGDGIRELLIGDVGNENSIYPGNDIAAVFTVVDGETAFLFEGWERNRYLYLGDGKFFNQGSSGAAYYSFSQFEIEKNSMDLIYEEHYFTDYDEATNSVIIYQNDEGIDDVESSEEMDWTTDDYFAAEDQLAQASVFVEMTAFNEYTFDGHGWYADAFNVDYVKNYEDGIVDDVALQYINSDQGQDNILICIDNKSVTEFSVVALSNFTIDEFGTMRFDCTELKNFGAVEKGEKILIGEDIYGTIPNYGIICAGEDGMIQRMAVQISGYDGSLVLSPFYENIDFVE